MQAHQTRTLLFSTAFCAAAFATTAGAQTLQRNTTQIPPSSGFTESVNFDDVDHDGDLDIAMANGGDFGNQQSVLWINQGGMQGGTVGFFTDGTAARFPAILTDG